MLDANYRDSLGKAGQMGQGCLEEGNECLQEKGKNGNNMREWKKMTKIKCRRNNTRKQAEM